MKMIVHDLKTPLTSIIGAMEMLMDGDFGALTTEQRGALGEAETRAEDLLGLIEDLLEVARLEESRLSLHLAPTAPGALLTEVRHEWEIRSQQEGAAIKVEVSDDAPIIDADQALLKRVFGNLIQNALTHSGARDDAVRSARAGRMTGRCSPSRTTAWASRSSITTSSSGSSSRVRTPNIPRVRSSGLGLAFCKLVVEAHGGRIWVKSGGDMVGSAFHFWLPTRPPSSSVSLAS